MRHCIWPMRECHGIGWDESTDHEVMKHFLLIRERCMECLPCGRRSAGSWNNSRDKGQDTILSHIELSSCKFLAEFIKLGIIFKLRFYFLEQFKVHRKIKRRVQRVPIYPLTPISTSPIRMMHLFQLMTLYQRIIIAKSPWFILGFTLGFVCSMGLDTFIMTGIHHYTIIESIFTVLNIL